MIRLKYSLGLMIAFAAIAFSIFYLKQPLSSYFDPVALMMVIGGTISVSIITLPIAHLKELFKTLRNIFWPQSFNKTELVRQSLSVIVQKAWNNGLPQIGGLPQQILEEGIELLDLNFAPDQMKMILQTRIQSAVRQHRQISSSVKSLGKFPPAFGLIGTVVGLVNLMRQISSGMDPKQTGLEMSVALIATLYGLILSNLFILPAGELMLKSAQDELEAAEIVMNALILSAKGTDLLTAQELLNSHVAKDQRASVLQMDERAS